MRKAVATFLHRIGWLIHTERQAATLRVQTNYRPVTRQALFVFTRPRPLGWGGVGHISAWHGSRRDMR